MGNRPGCSDDGPALCQLCSLRPSPPNQDYGSELHEEIPHCEADGPVPLSFSQERLWFLEQYDPGKALYNIPFSIPLHGEIDRGVIERAVNEIARRHESLRTTFATRESGPVQAIAPHLQIPLDFVDLCYVADEERQSRAMEYFAEQSRRPFDLSSGPLIRTSLVKLSDDLHLVFVVMHHIVSDAASIAVFQREFQILTQAFSQRRPSPLPELAIQFRDFSAWQRDRLSQDAVQSQLEYWRWALAGLDFAPLELPADRARLAYPSYQAGTLSFSLEESLSNRIDALFERHGTSAFMVLLAGLKALLFRYTCQETIVVGFPVESRNQTELQGLIGPFVNWLPLRSSISPQTTFNELLVSVREGTIAAEAHRDIPFQRLVEELHPARNLNFNPIFQVMFDFADEATRSELQFAITTNASQFDLGLSMTRAGSRFRGNVVFSSDLFDEPAIHRLIGHFQMLLSGMMRQPECPISQFDLMTSTERELVLNGFNQTEMTFPEDASLSELFEAQTRITPDLPAAVFEDRLLTYCELNRAANRLARRLRQLGVGPESIVAICTEGSLEMVIGILGVLKAGGAYLPIDPSYPQDRIAFMILDAGVRIALTHKDTRAFLDGLAPLIIELDEPADDLLDSDGENLSPLAKSNNAAYVIYTSGSTGRPKGVLIDHRSVVSLVSCLKDRFSIGPGSRVLQFASFSFDVSVREVFESLLTGAALHLARREDMAPGEPLLRLLKERRITTVTLAPSVWAHLPDTDLPDLKTAIAGGEACPMAVVNRWAPSRDFFNAYGPTETTVASSVAQCFPNIRPTIGPPLANTRYYVVDENLMPCVIGSIGELLIGGIGLARGYVGRPDLTAERFIPDPFSKVPGARVFRTGDSVRLLQNGDVDYLGRTDRQVKIRGFRIELGEIETVLMESEDVAAAAVSVFTGGTGSKRLIAYLVPADPSIPVPLEKIRAFAASKLPHFMLPANFMFLEHIPLTPAGKVDVKALPHPDESAVRRLRIEPRTEVECILAEIWCELLKLDAVSLDDDFFELGGQSLAAARLFAKIEERLGKRLPLAAIFKAPTLRQLAERVELLSEQPHEDSDEWSPMVIIRSTGRRPPLFLVHGLHGNVIRFKGLSVHLPEDQPIYAFQSRGLKENRAVETSIEEMAQTYMALLRKIQPHGPYYIGGFSAGGVVAYEMAQQLIRSGEQVAGLFLFDAALVRSLVALIRFREFRQAADRALRYALKHFADLAARANVQTFLRSKAENFLMKLRIALYEVRLGLGAPSGFLAMREGFLRAVSQYKPKPYPGEAIFFRSAYSRKFQPWTAREWNELVMGPFRCIDVAGNHGTMFLEPQVEVLGREICACLQAQEAEADLAELAAMSFGSAMRQSAPLDEPVALR